MIEKNGGSDFEEFVTDGYTRRFYGDHAISGIVSQIKEGLPPETGKTIWY